MYEASGRQFTPSYFFDEALWITDRGEIRHLPIADPDWIITAYELLNHPPHSRLHWISGTDPSLESAVARVRLGGNVTETPPEEDSEYQPSE
jgi:hypothetical protein